LPKIAITPSSLSLTFPLLQKWRSESKEKATADARCLRPVILSEAKDLDVANLPGSWREILRQAQIQNDEQGGLTESNICFKHLFVTTRAAPDTRDRLIAAASQLFAERGFHGTKVRDIAARAGVNLAAGNYHYGSKKALYLEVLRAQFAAIRALLERRGATRPANELSRLSRAAVIALLQARAHAMLDLLIGPPPGLHGTLMQREMTDPSEALPVIVEEFIRPMKQEIEEIVVHLAPRLNARAVERCAFSIVGQALFYRFTLPATLKMWGLRAYPRTLSRQLAEHITEFSLGGIERVTKKKARWRDAR
jgi:AcrR family transcriptional regulator